MFFFVACFCSTLFSLPIFILISIRLGNILKRCAILLQYPVIQSASKERPGTVWSCAYGINLDSAVSFYKLAVKISKHHWQLVHVCSLMCDNTACEYGGLVGCECGSSTKYPSTEYVRIGKYNRSIERHFTDTLQAIFANQFKHWSRADISQGR